MFHKNVYQLFKCFGDGIRNESRDCYVKSFIYIILLIAYRINLNFDLLRFLSTDQSLLKRPFPPFAQ